MSGPFTKSILSWGRAVKSWATGLDYVNTEFTDHPPSASIPANACELFHSCRNQSH